MFGNKFTSVRVCVFNSNALMYFLFNKIVYLPPDANVVERSKKVNNQTSCKKRA